MYGTWTYDFKMAYFSSMHFEKIIIRKAHPGFQTKWARNCITNVYLYTFSVIYIENINVYHCLDYRW